MRSAEALGSIFTDPERVKWVLLQPEVDGAARRFASLAALGDKRATEAREAREALGTLLVADLASERSEHIEKLLDLMQRDARDGMQRYVSEAPPPAPEALEYRAPQPLRIQVAEMPAPLATVIEPTQPPRSTEPPSDSRGPQAEPQPERVAYAPQRDDDSLAPVEYELRVLSGSTMGDVDLRLVREYVQGSTGRRPSSSLSDLGEVEVLRALRAIDGPVGRERLTVLGGLFFSLRPEHLVVQSKVRFVEFPGTEVASSGETVAYRYTEEVTGTIPQLIARMERLHKERLAPGVLADGFRVEEVPAVPLFALREAMVNAVCHRDYALVGANIQVRLFADRLEVQSPGGLPGSVTVDNILTESYARNPRIADILRDLGYVERHGLGIDNMFTSMEDAHLPPPEFTNSETSFTVTLRFRAPDEADPASWLADIGAGSLALKEHKALVFARRTGRIVSADYQSLNSVDGTEADTQLRALVRSGWLVQHGTRGEAYYALGPKAGSTPDTAVDAPLPDAVLDSLSASQRRILDIVVRQRKVKVSEVLEISGLKDRRTIQRALAALAERGLVVRHASSRTDPNATYEVNRDFRADGLAQDPPS